MAAILADGIFKCIFLNVNDVIPIQILLKFVPKSPFDNKAALVQVMSWRRTGDKPSSEPMLKRFTDAYMQYYGEMRYEVMWRRNRFDFERVCVRINQTDSYVSC